MKLSGVGCVFQHLEKEKINHYIEQAIHILGVERCLFGSNCPPDTLFYDFNKLMLVYYNAVSSLTEEEQYQFFYLNDKNIIRHNFFLIFPNLN